MSAPLLADQAEARESVLQLARLYGLRVTVADEDEVSAAPAHPVGSPAGRLMTARAWIRANALRARRLEGSLFADPAWDLLLDLYVNRQEHRKVSITSACVAANVPQTTALRWITSLTERGWLRRTKDHIDGRRHFIELPDHVAEAMDLLLDDVMQSDKKIGLERMRIVPK